jgi:putative DNA methylase
VNPALYGIRTHADFLNPRQRAVLILLVKALHAEYERLRAKTSEAAATYVIGLLSALIDQIVDWNCRLSMWIPQNEQVGRAFCGPGISMLWDYVETDPVSNGPSNLWNKLNRIVKGSQSIPRFPGRGHVAQAHAQSLPYPEDYFDAIVTDPPYYDNLYYSVLADFFYAWKRLLLQKIEPDIFEAPSTECDRELVASKYRNGTGQRAHRTYCEQLERAVAEAARVLKPQGVFCLLYSHSSLNGWDALVKAYRAANLVITTVQPLSIERRQRPRAMTSRVVNTCLTFVARKSDGPKAIVAMSGILKRFREICTGRFITNLERSGWAATDAGMAAFAQGVALLANHKTTRSGADMDALIALGNIVRERIPGFRVSRRKSL